MPPLAFNGSPEDLARFIAALAAGGGLSQPSEAAGHGQEEAAGSGAARASAGFRGEGPLLLVSVPGFGMVGAALDPSGQNPLSPFLPGDFGVSDSSSDPSGMSEAIRAAMEQMMHLMTERSLQEQQPSVPPANEGIRDALPRVIVTKEDQLDDVNSKCAVCFEEFKAGMRATRMFCGHLFCTNCIREWLRMANSCPTCRFELATDRPEYEEGRVQRMHGRVARLKGGELRMMRVPELKRLMRALGVSGEGCVEKADLIRQLGAAPGVELTQDRKDIFYDRSELQGLELPYLRSLMERHCLKMLTNDMDEVEERAAALERFAAAGWITAQQKAGPSGSEAWVPKTVEGKIPDRSSVAARDHCCCSGERLSPINANQLIPGGMEQSSPGGAKRQSRGGAELRSSSERRSPESAERPSPVGVGRLSPGRVERSSPGHAEQQSLGSVKGQSPGHAGRLSPGGAARSSPGGAERRSPGGIERRSRPTAERPSHTGAEQWSPHRAEWLSRSGAEQQHLAAFSAATMDERAEARASTAAETTATVGGAPTRLHRRSSSSGALVAAPGGSGVARASPLPLDAASSPEGPPVPRPAGVCGVLQRPASAPADLSLHPARPSNIEPRLPRPFLGRRERQGR